MRICPFTLLLLMLTVRLSHTVSPIFLGGTINWRSVGGKVRFNSRTTWKTGYGPCGSVCNKTSIGKMTTGGSPFDSIFWQALGVNLSDINYVTTSSEPEWEQGEDVFSFVSNSTSQFTVRLTSPGFLWIPTANETSGRHVSMETLVDTRIRNDTKQPNASPIAALPPYTGVPYGCLAKISVPITEPDHDFLRCRWAKPTECGSVCSNFPEAYIDKSSCTITLNTTSDRGYQPGQSYRVTLVVEDFPRYPILIEKHLKTPSDPLSRIPVQFTITLTRSTSCRSVSTFVSPTLPDEVHASYSQFPTKFQFAAYLSTSYSSGNAFVTSFPAGMVSQKLTDDQGRPNVTRLYLTWLPQRRQLGDNLACIWGKDQFGATTSQRCVDALISDADECLSSPCQGGGTCVNLFHRFICDCPHGLMPPLCSRKINCGDHPCLNNGTCVNTLSSFNCTCSKGFSGDRCQTERNLCVSMPCLNGGKCHSGIGTFTCSCTSQYTGLTCDQKLHTATQSSQKQNLKITVDNMVPQDPWIILTGVLGGLLGLSVIGGCCFWGISKIYKSSKGRIGNSIEEPLNIKRVQPIESSLKTDRKLTNENDSRRPFSVSSSIGNYPGSNILTPIDSGPYVTPQTNNIYLSSLTDPLMHKCGR